MENNTLPIDEIKRIKSLCKNYNIIKYSINPDGSIDVDGDVYMARKNLIRIPMKFNFIRGSFICHTNNLSTLENAPSIVMRNFICHNNLLTSLEGVPAELHGEVNFTFNKLPPSFVNTFKLLDKEQQEIFFKYQDYYKVWTPAYNRDNMINLVDEIVGGLE